MKVNKSFTLELELIEMLNKEDNASRLVEDLVNNHYHETKDFKHMRIMNKIKIIKQQEKDIKFEKDRLEQEVKAFRGKEVKK